MPPSMRAGSESWHLQLHILSLSTAICGPLTFLLRFRPICRSIGILPHTACKSACALVIVEHRRLGVIGGPRGHHPATFATSRVQEELAAAHLLLGPEGRRRARSAFHPARRAARRGREAVVKHPVCVRSCAARYASRHVKRLDFCNTRPGGKYEAIF
jgi:hypothetical protein